MNRFEREQEELKKELANLNSLNVEEETLEDTIHSFGIKIINSTSSGYLEEEENEEFLEREN